MIKCVTLLSGRLRNEAGQWEGASSQAGAQQGQGGRSQDGHAQSQVGITQLIAGDWLRGQLVLNSSLVFTKKTHLLA